MAQNATPAVEVTAPTPGSTWTVNIDHLQPTPTPTPNDPKAEKVVSPLANKLVLKLGTNGVGMGEIFYPDGHRETYYTAEGLLFLEAKNTQKIFPISVESSEIDPMSLRVASYPGTRWINKSLLIGIDKREDGDFFHYEFKEPTQEGTLELRLEAWVRVENRIPFEVRLTNEAVYRFQPAVPFPEEIQLPDSYKPVLKQWKAELNAAELIRKGGQP